MYKQLYFYHPSWNNIFLFNVLGSAGIYDVLAYISSAGYIPFNPNGHGLAIKDKWITDNYTVDSLGLTIDNTIIIVPLNPVVKPITPDFGNGQHQIFANPDYQPQNIPIDSKEKLTLLEWIKNLIKP